MKQERGRFRNGANWRMQLFLLRLTMTVPPGLSGAV
jgi:hypothetical protein